MESENLTAFVAALYVGLLKREASEDEIGHHVSAVLNGLLLTELVAQFRLSQEFSGAGQTRLFVPPGHFYSPIPSVDQITAHLERTGRQRENRSIADINIDDPAMVRLWKMFVPLLREISFPHEKAPGFRYKSDNHSYGLGDASILYAMIRHFRPRKIVEVGSGWSSACTIDTAELYLPDHCRLTFIEPYPQLLLDVIGDGAERFNIISKAVQDVPLSVFRDLEAGDILFIDSTHIASTGSDVCWEVFEILPTLKSGVIVHFHDIFWPFEYPEEWSQKEQRAWNETYLLRSFLTRNDKWKILFINDYFNIFHSDLVQKTYPAFGTNAGGALWMQKS